MTARRFVIVALVVALPALLPAQEHHSKVVNEAVIFSGTTLKPVHRVTNGASFGFGYGKNLVNFAVEGEALGSHALGIGESFYPNASDLNQFPVSSSHTFDINLSYQRDIFGLHNGLLTVYGSGGGGYLRNSFTVTHPCIFISCFPGPLNPPPIVEVQKTGNFGITAGGGVRVRIWRTVGVRGEFKVWNTNGGTITPGGRGFPQSSVSDHLVRATLGIYIHSRYNGWLKN